MKSFALVFPGQGSQYVGMGKELFKRYETVKKHFQLANEVLGFDLQKLCFEGSLEELTKTVNTQPAILTCSIAAYIALLEEKETLPSYAAGHSLGEFSALVAANVISFEDALLIVRQRGQFMQDAISKGKGAMAAITNLSKAEVEKICEELTTGDDFVVPSNYNSPKQIVISGSQKLVNAACDKCTEKGGIAIPLKVSAPFHSPYMESASINLQSELKKYTFNSFEYPVISNVTGQAYHAATEVPDLLVEQMVKPVQWNASVNYMASKGVEEFIELGPKTVLKRLINVCEPSVNVLSSDENMMDIKLKYGPSNNNEIKRDKVVPKLMAIAVSTRNHNFNNEQFERGVTQNYKRLKELNQSTENTEEELSDKQLQEAFGWLNEILDTKAVPTVEKKERIDELMEATNTAILFN